MQRSFQEYIRQRVTSVESAAPDHHVSRLDAVEAGEDEEYTSTRTGNKFESDSGFVTPYGGVGPLVMSFAEKVGKKRRVFPFSNDRHCFAEKVGKKKGGYSFSAMIDMFVEESIVSWKGCHYVDTFGKAREMPFFMLYYDTYTYASNLLQYSSIHYLPRTRVPRYIGNYDASRIPYSKHVLPRHIVTKTSSLLSNRRARVQAGLLLV